MKNRWYFFVKAKDIIQCTDFGEVFAGANTTLGCLIMKFDSMEEMLDMMDNSEKWCKVKLKE